MATEYLMLPFESNMGIWPSVSTSCWSNGDSTTCTFLVIVLNVLNMLTCDSIQLGSRNCILSMFTYWETNCQLYILFCWWIFQPSDCIWLIQTHRTVYLTKLTRVRNILHSLNRANYVVTPEIPRLECIAVSFSNNAFALRQNHNK